MQEDGEMREEDEFKILFYDCINRYVNDLPSDTLLNGESLKKNVQKIKDNIKLGMRVQINVQ